MDVEVEVEVDVGNTPPVEMEAQSTRVLSGWKKGKRADNARGKRDGENTSTGGRNNTTGGTTEEDCD